MNAKHTPGPWAALQQRDRTGRPLGWIILHEGGRVGWESTAYSSSNSEAGPEDPARAANARLIAAAPELLEALLPFAQVDLRTQGVHQNFAQHVLRARAAVAKATGSAA